MTFENTSRRFKPKIAIPRLNLVLFVATVGTTLAAGYLQSLSLVRLEVLQSAWHGAIAFCLGILGILGCHEMGHKLMADRRGIKASFPYFIPAPTLIGTFGAIIRMRTRPGNRNSLFDVGAAGPIGGILVVIPVTILGLLWSFPVPIESVKGIVLPEPLLFQWLGNWLVRVPSESVLLLHPLAFAGWVGMVITMLNLMPVGMLDGGHISMALFGGKRVFRFFFFELSLPRVISLIGVLVTMMLGYWLMALLILFLGGAGHPGPVNDAIPLSNGRKILALGLMCLLVVCTTSLRSIILR
ncbi:site-2 protease family protein [Candidatus Aerophobetes bacterium]|uniref:Site-2 protease family protein n=1 Tax=Aerophobetes bacterium TaxID=2030807 RepID=A0A523UTI9_UNCAE|nr:MAG: site-2 protease family protein [Candidatus Aerophobetes bacterium]